MIIQFRLANIRSLRDEQVLSMVASTRADTGRAGRAVPGAPVTALCAAGIFGANASGKSNVLKALRYMCRAVEDSHRQWQPDQGVPRTPFCLDGGGQQRPTELELDFLLDEVRYSYGFRVDDEQILAEWLHAFPQGRRQSWFTREKSTFSFGKKLAGQNRAITALTRKNSLFLSAAAQNNHEQLMPLYQWLVQSIRFIDPRVHPVPLTRARLPVALVPSRAGARQSFSMNQRDPAAVVLDCRRCGAQITAENIDLTTALARCHRCHAVFGFADQLSGANPPPPPMDRPLPDGFTMSESGGRLRLVHRWYRPVLFVALLACIFWSAGFALWYELARSPSEIPLVVLLAAIVHVTVGVSITYATLAGFFNRTIIEADTTHLAIRHTPMPWPGNREVRAGDLQQLFCEEQVDNKSVTYRLSAVLRDGRKLPLVKTLPEPNQALFLEHTLERRLGIVNQAVAGELHR